MKKASSFRRVAILGPGLLGGSLGLALRRHRLAREVVIWGRRGEVARQAVACRAAHRAASSPEDAVRGADLVILCTPAETMSELVRGFRSHLRRGALVTDVGSTKREVVRRLSALLAGRAVYIGSHPMAGGERDGLAAARPNLFEGSLCILTPRARTPTAALQRLAELWEAIGCRVRTVPPARHDAITARISHAPHLAAAALINMVAHDDPGALDFIGNGFRDMTRIAGGPAEMWTGIVLSNSENIRGALGALIRELEAVRRDIARGSKSRLLAFLRQAREHRNRLRHHHS